MGSDLYDHAKEGTTELYGPVTELAETKSTPERIGPWVWLGVGVWFAALVMVALTGLVLRLVL